MIRFSFGSRPRRGRAGGAEYVRIDAPDPDGSGTVSIITPVAFLETSPGRGPDNLGPEEERASSTQRHDQATTWPTGFPRSIPRESNPEDGL